MAEKKSWVMYKTWIPLFTSLPTEKAGELIKAICAYENGWDVALSDPIISSVFVMIKNTLEKDAEEYEKVCQKRAESASKANASKSKQKRANATKRKQKDATEGDNDNENDNDNDNVYPSDIKDRGARSRFIPPTVEEVKAYCQERGNNVDAEHFVAYYSSQRWKKANGQAVSDWKGCVRTWEKKDDRQQVARSGTPPNNKIHNFPERQYDYGALEKALTQNGG